MFLQPQAPSSARNKVNVYAILKNAIQFMELKPGTTISETEIASMLGVSRTPIREALIRLADDLLIEIYPQRGTYVSKINLALVREMTYMRHIIETDIFLKLCESKTAVMHLVEDKLSLMQIALKNHDAVAYLIQDEAFHRALFACNQHEAIWNIISSTRAHYIRVLVLDMMLPNSLEESYQDHLKIIESIEQGDQDTLLEVLNHHHDFNQISHEKELKEMYSDYFL